MYQALDTPGHPGDAQSLRFNDGRSDTWLTCRGQVVSISIPQSYLEAYSYWSRETYGSEVPKNAHLESVFPLGARFVLCTPVCWLSCPAGQRTAVAQYLGTGFLAARRALKPNRTGILFAALSSTIDKYSTGQIVLFHGADLG